MKLKITVHGVAYEVDVEVLDAKDEFAAATPLPPMRRSAAPAGNPAGAPPVAPPPGRSGQAPAGASPAAAAGGKQVASPIAGTVVEVKCKAGDEVRQGQELLVIEAMKMETAISAPAAGKVKSVPVAAGDSIRENEVLVEFE
ncbi:MAG: biotin/lipoyl-containing protein [Candidatus Krumholzibacteriia bacterium]